LIEHMIWYWRFLFPTNNRSHNLSPQTILVEISDYHN
jgi:hypothetical protein